MPRETMTPRERWLAVLTRQTPDRVPMDYWATPEMTARLIRFMGKSTKSERELIADMSVPGEDAGLMKPQSHHTASEMLKALHIDFAVAVAPRYEGPPLPAGTDVFGCQFQNVDYGAGAYAECIHNPLAGYHSVEEIEDNYSWPDLDWWNYTTLADQIRGFEEYPIRGGGSEPFLIYCRLRGMEQAFVDMVLNPEMVHYCLDKLFGLCYEITTRVYEQIPGKVLFSYVAEDMGSQKGLMFSRKHIREFLLPRMKRMIDLVHQGGAFAFHHNDGNCREIIPDMIEAGIDILNPIQWRSDDMDREGLKRDFGDQIIFHGGVDNQQTLPFGTVEDVKEEVLDNLRILGAGEGYILAPCHNIQSITPPENVVAMYEAGYENGWT